MKLILDVVTSEQVYSLVLMEEAAESSAAPCQLPTLDTTYEQYGGRDPEAKELAQWMQKPDIRAAAVVASGGMGKTCLAVDVAWRLWRCKQCSAGVLYVDCRGAFSRDAMVMRLRAAAGLSGEQGGVEGLLTALGKMCSADRLGGSLLVVVDNAEDPAAADGGTALAEVLTQLLLASAKIQLLVTSRVDVAVHNMPPPHTHRIAPLAPAVAAGLVQQLAKGVLTGEESRTVAEACGCVPLALRLVSEALVAGALPLEDVQEAVATRQDSTAPAADSGGGSTADRQQKQDMTVMFVEMVLRSLPAAMKEIAMQISAFTGVLTAASTAVVMGVVGSSEHEVRAQLASLHRLSVVLQHGDDSFLMHTHVRDVARKLLAEEAPPALRTAVRERFAHYAAGLLSRWQRLHESKALKLMAAEVAAHWSDVEQFLADVAGEAAGGNRPLLGAAAPPLPLSPQLLKDTALLSTLGNSDSLYAIGNAWMSAQYLTLTQKLVEVTGQPAPSQEGDAAAGEREQRLSHAAALLVRCEALMYTGEYEESEGLAARAVELYEQLLGRDSVGCAAALHLRASCLQGQGRGTDAVPLYRESLAVRQEALGPTHRHTTATITHLAMQLSMEGAHSEAEGLYRQVLEAHQRNLGSSHNLTAQALSNLAGCLHELGKLAEAEAMYRKALNVAFTLVGLAAVVREGGDLEAAEELYRQALDVCRTALGSRHPHSQMTLVALRELLTERGKDQEAEALEL
ncbi:TPR repeat domain, kinesin-like protein [Volvox carteri f. nagariensis]|uniref:TPR repeat domain, kinesin-like protein n=1 Tax=Volvox carteri f. nagariensis TaxID=3068 RepID=D8TWF9_VOLCA|nr:TPR repeat domain, kinesin-like protein [Volvox carteri f. nagariensis]EFJ48040.1 TPR repeat domain, kinesin-like protein [Volvox carteri f. nagariensis]|eukprot:XP_002950725.1 TPR repeat domain, kinesin-like protein [Volvox carteri f. nagariensis]